MGVILGRVEDKTCLKLPTTNDGVYIHIYIYILLCVLGCLLNKKNIDMCPSLCLFTHKVKQIISAKTTRNYSYDQHVQYTLYNAYIHILHIHVLHGQDILILPRKPKTLSHTSPTVSEQQTAVPIFLHCTSLAELGNSKWNYPAVGCFCLSCMRSGHYGTGT